MERFRSTVLRAGCRSGVLVLLLACLPLYAAEPPWGYGRIVSVSKSVTSRTKAWVVNTPITEEETTCTVAVHVQNQILVGNYRLAEEEAGPPPRWSRQRLSSRPREGRPWRAVPPSDS